MDLLKNVPSCYQSPIFVCKKCQNLISFKSHLKTQRNLILEFDVLYFYEALGKSSKGNIYFLACLKCKSFIGIRFVSLKAWSLLPVWELSKRVRVLFRHRSLFSQEGIFRNFWKRGKPHENKNIVESQTEF